MMRGPSQNSFSCDFSSEAKSSSGRQNGPASNPITENPYSASLQARVPPPAPVPTIAKSTSSSSRKQRIGNQPPRCSGSGARPSLALGLARGLTRGLSLIVFFFLHGVPRVGRVRLHPEIPAGRARPAKPDLAPRRGVRVIDADRLLQQHALEKLLGRHALPRIGQRIAVLHRAQHR